MERKYRKSPCTLSTIESCVKSSLGCWKEGYVTLILLMNYGFAELSMLCKIQSEFFISRQRKTIQPETGKMAGQETFYVRRKREGAAAAEATIFEKCPRRRRRQRRTVNLKRAAERDQKGTYLHSSKNRLL